MSARRVQLLIKETGTWPADYFLKLDPKVEGESTDSKHKGEIELESWSFGVSQQLVRTPGRRCGCRQVGLLRTSTSTKKSDKASARLAQAVRDGRALQVGDPHRAQGRRNAAGVPDHHAERRVHLSYQAGGSGGGKPADGAALAELREDLQEYKEQKPDGTLGGSVKLGYDWSKQVKI